MSEKDLEQALIERAEDEASEVAICLFKFRRHHESCAACRFRGFCETLVPYLEELEAEG